MAGSWEGLLVGGGDPLASSLVRDYFSSNPKVAEAFQNAGARVVIFERGDAGSPTPFFASMQRALDAAEALLLPDERPVYLAWTTVPEVVAANAFELRRGSVAAECVPLVSKRGPFLGYLAVGEGGLAYFDAKGLHHGNQPRREDVLRALAWPWETKVRGG